jgi:hypothetical protein
MNKNILIEVMIYTITIICIVIFVCSYTNKENLANEYLIENFINSL